MMFSRARVLLSESATYLGLGTVSGGNPFGSVPTSETPRPASLNAADAVIAMMTATSTPGTLGSQRPTARITTRLKQADRDRGADRLAVGEAMHERARLVDQAVGVSREPEQLR